jgi:DNA-binding transcriptional ArsR family regulator
VNEQKIEFFAALLSALANPARIKILTLLIQEEIPVTTIALRLGSSQSVISQHLAKLRNLNLVTTRRDGQTIYYYCQSSAVFALLQTLEKISFELPK